MHTASTQSDIFCKISLRQKDVSLCFLMVANENVASILGPKVVADPKCSLVHCFLEQGTESIAL